VKIQQQREKQLELIDQLKCQLEDLETYAYEVSMRDLLGIRVTVMSADVRYNFVDYTK